MIRTVKTKYGILEGVESNAGFSLFRGIPYAAPPIGDNRWRAPQKPDSWEGIRKCDTYGPACGQFDRWDTATDDITDDSGHPYIKIKNYPYPPKMDEDCLYLNIYTPAAFSSDRLPVMVYLHGGGCQQWYGSDYEYCGDNFCKQGCILVSVTYRLNVFGYFTHPELAKESGHNASGNYGLMDQIAAIRWVYENITAFGGDAENITVFGQSAGGRSTLAAACSPLSENRIKRISLQSCGGIGTRMGETSREETEAKGIRFMESLGCKTIAEMRALPWQALRDANDKMGGMHMGFNMYTDGYVLPKDIDSCILDGSLRDLDIIIGCTADEGFNGRKPRFGGNMFVAIAHLAKTQLKNGKKPAFMYVFDREQPGDDAGVPHSCDNRYQFGTLDGSWRPYEACDHALSDTMLKYWSNFAKTGDPNGIDVPVWEAFTGDGKVMHLSIDECATIPYKETTI